MPVVPDAPPPAPSLAGVTIPAVTPSPAPIAPPAPPALVVVKPGAPVAIPFLPGSAILPTDALAPIKMLARQRGAGSIAVTGFGEAVGTDPAAQAAALPLALSRARAVAASLLAAGVPSGSIRIAAEPQGTGAAAQITN